MTCSRLLKATARAKAGVHSEANAGLIDTDFNLLISNICDNMCKPSV
jgi:hypothetical protein